MEVKYCRKYFDICNNIQIYPWKHFQHIYYNTMTAFMT